MKRNRAVFWFIAWVVAFVLGEALSVARKISDLFANGMISKAPPFSNGQLALLLGYVPFVLIPLLGVACYYAIKENRKGIKIASVLLMIYHIICVMIVLFLL